MTHKRVYTQKLLHREAYTQESFYTQMRLHGIFDTHRFFNTQKLLHTEKSLHRNLMGSNGYVVASNGLMTIPQCGYIILGHRTFDRKHADEPNGSCVVET